MTKQERYFIEQQIVRLKKRKQNIIDEMIGACNEINHEIREYRKQLIEDMKNERQ